MADNYLEKRMEDYRSGAARMFKAPSPQRSAFVVDGLSAAGEAKVRELRSGGIWRVAFAGSDVHAGMRLAQATGSRFYPVDPSDAEAVAKALDDASKRWGEIEVILSV